MTPEEIQNQILLRSSGESSPADQAALAEVLKEDPQAADYARFIDLELPLASRAPRDFVAQALLSAETPQRPVVLRRRVFLSLAGAAAAAAIGLLLVREPAHNHTSQQVTHREPEVPKSRETHRISSALAALDTELTTARTQLGRGRYHRSSPL